MSQIRLEEDVVPGKRLGRHVLHDPKSLQFLVKPAAALAVSIEWQFKSRPLDQGDLGACTGFSTIHCMGTDPYFPTMQNWVLDEDLARKVYSMATARDPWEGVWPTEDTGSDGLSAAKSAKDLGLISGYLHMTSVDAMITGLQTGPIIVGVPWYSGFDRPDAYGNVVLSGSVRGGHEFAVLGVNLEAKKFKCLNSWGTGFADNGYFYVSFADMARLLSEYGDATSFVPITAPAPQPKETHDADLVLVMDKWERTIISRFTTAGKAAEAYRVWKRAKGY